MRCLPPMLAMLLITTGGCSLLFDGNSFVRDDEGDASTSDAAAPYELRPLWVRTLTGIGSDEFRACAFDDQDNVYAVGTYSSDSAMLEADPSGELPSGGLDDALVVSYDEAGSYRWKYLLNSEGNDRLDDVATGNSSVFAAGHFSDQSGFDFGDNAPVPTIDREAVTVRISAEGGEYEWHSIFTGAGNQTHRGVRFGGGNVYVAGSATNLDEINQACGAVSGGGEELFVAQLAGMGGECRWRSEYTTPQDDQAQSLDVGSTSPLEVFVGGRVDGTLATSQTGFDLYIGAFDSAGAAEWPPFVGEQPVGFSATIDVEATSIGVCGTGLFLDGPVSFNRDGSDPIDPGNTDSAFVTCRNASGNNSWTQTFGGTGEINMRGAGSVGTGLIAATGSYTGAADFGDGDVTADSEDLMIVVRAIDTGEHRVSLALSAAGEERALGLSGRGNKFCVAGQFATQLLIGVEERTSAADSVDGFVAVFELIER